MYKYDKIRLYKIIRGNIKMNKKEFEIIAKVAERAENMGLLLFDRLSLIMDLKCVSEIWKLNFEEFLNADEFNFTHDICGIQNNLNRMTKEMENSFVPRFAR